jgi:Flp pilus assembly protein TadB
MTKDRHTVEDRDMTGFDIFDRYDFMISLLFGAVMAGALALGAPLWVLVLLMFICSLIVFIRHFDETMAP